jgi:tetratricopeptide (TPR) repeat protein
MRQSGRLVAGVLSVILVAAEALPICAKDAQWESHFSAGTKAESEGNFDEAQNELAEALKQTAKFQANDPRLAKTYYEVAELRLKQEDWANAQQYFERALKVQDKLGDPESIDIGNTLQGLATAHEQLGKHQMAVLLLKRVRKIWTKHYGARDERLTTILPAMATYAMLDSDYATAQECYRQLVDIEEHTSGANSARFGWALNSYASCLAYIGKYSEAEPLAERAVSVLTAAGDTPTAIDSATANLQYIYQKLGKAAPPLSEKPVVDAPAKTQVAVQPSSPVSTLKVTGQIITPKKEVTEIVPQQEVPVVASRPEVPVVVQRKEAPVAQKKEEPAPIKVKEVPATKPVESKSTTTQTASVPIPSNEKSGKIQYLAGGRLISPEQFKAMTLANNAYELIREEKYTMAVQILKNALVIYPELVSAHSNLGLAYSQLGQLSDAESQLRKAISIDASRPAAWLNLAGTLQIGGQLKEAAATYGEFIQRFPNQKLVAKVQEIKSHLDKELKEQATVEQSGAQTPNDYFTYASHASNEGPSRWPSDKSTIKVYIASGTGTPGFKDEYAGFLADSFKQWETACQQKVRFQLVKSANGSDIECAWTDDASKISPLEGGETSVQHGGTKISHATITILTKGPTGDTPLSPNQLRVVCLHQIGHALGIAGHSPKPQDVMFCSLPPATSKLSISSRDSATIQKLYTGVPQVSMAKW